MIEEPDMIDPSLVAIFSSTYIHSSKGISMWMAGNLEPSWFLDTVCQLYYLSFAEV